MEIPILRMGNFLLVSIQVDMHDRLAMTLQDDLTTKIVETGACGVLIDISALEIVDSFIGRMIGNISAMARVLDAETVIVGMRSRRRRMGSSIRTSVWPICSSGIMRPSREVRVKSSFPVTFSRLMFWRAMSVFEQT